MTVYLSEPKGLIYLELHLLFISIVGTIIGVWGIKSTILIFYLVVENIFYFIRHCDIFNFFFYISHLVLIKKGVLKVKLNLFHSPEFFNRCLKPTKLFW